MTQQKTKIKKEKINNLEKKNENLKNYLMETFIEKYFQANKKILSCSFSENK